MTARKDSELTSAGPSKLDRTLRRLATPMLALSALVFLAALVVNVLGWTGYGVLHHYPAVQAIHVATLALFLPSVFVASRATKRHLGSTRVEIKKAWQTIKSIRPKLLRNVMLPLVLAFMWSSPVYLFVVSPYMYTVEERNDQHYAMNHGREIKKISPEEAERAYAASSVFTSGVWLMFDWLSLTIWSLAAFGSVDEQSETSKDGTSPDGRTASDDSSSL